MASIKKIIENVLYFVFKLLYKFVPVDDKLVIFISFHGKTFSDNPRAIYDYMIQDNRFKNFKFIWFIKNHKKKNISIPKGKVVEYFGFSYFYYLFKAKYWIINIKMPAYIPKKDNQIYLQTWHGTPLKRLARDISVNDNATFYRSGMTYEKMCQTYEADAARYNYMISPNKFCTEIFPHAFGVDESRLIETGYPRNDFITNASLNDFRLIKKKYNLPQDKKIVLYAPTWRDNSYVAAGYTFDLQANFHQWKKVLGDDYIVLFKPHYTIINKYENDKSLEGFLYSISAESEINELYVISDILVTDYSSVFFDYAVLNKPIYFYMYDLEQYAQDLRGFYLDIHHDLPGKIYRREIEMLEDMKSGIYDYDFLKTFNQRFNAQQTGNCAQKVIDIVFHDIK